MRLNALEMATAEGPASEMCHLALPDEYRGVWQDERGLAKMYSVAKRSLEEEKNNA